MTGIILIDVLLSYHPASLPSYPHLPYHQLAIPCIYQSKPGLPGTDKPSIRGFWMDWQVERDVNAHRTGKKWILDVAGWWDRWLFGMFQYGAGKLLVYLVTISFSDTGIMHGFWKSSDTLPEEKYQGFWGKLEIYGYTRRLSCLLFNVLNIRFQICFLCCKTTVFPFLFFFFVLRWHRCSKNIFSSLLCILSYFSWQNIITTGRNAYFGHGGTLNST